jgi:hypothetical protein
MSTKPKNAAESPAGLESDGDSQEPDDLTRVLDSLELPQLTLEQQVEILAEGISAFCQRVHDQGVDPSIMSTVLLTVYCEQMCDLGDRASYEQQLEAALDDTWEEHSLH